MDLIIITILPVVTKDLHISPRFTPYNFLSRCKFSTLTTRQPMVEFLLTHVPTLSVTEERTQILLWFGKNRTQDFRTPPAGPGCCCAGFLLEDHSGDEHNNVWIKYHVEASLSLQPVKQYIITPMLLDVVLLDYIVSVLFLLFVWCPCMANNCCCCCCCLHIKSFSGLYSVLSNIRTGPTDADAFRGHRLTTQKG